MHFILFYCILCCFKHPFQIRKNTAEQEYQIQCDVGHISGIVVALLHNCSRDLPWTVAQSKFDYKYNTIVQFHCTFELTMSGTTSFYCSFGSPDSDCGIFGESPQILTGLNSCQTDMTSYLSSLGVSAKRSAEGQGVISEQELILNRGRLHWWWHCVDDYLPQTSS